MRKSISLLLVALIAFSLCSIIASAGELVNVAQGKKYTVDIGSEGTPGYSCPDPDDGSGFGDGKNLERQRLTDGVIGGADGGLFGIIGAQQTPKAIYVIDLGSVVNGIKKLNMDLYYGPWGIGEAFSVEYALSTDGVNYTTVGIVERQNAVNKANADWKGDDYILTLSEPKSARYVKMTATATNFIWTSEMQVFAENSSGNSQSGSSQSSSSSSSQSSSSSGGQSGSDNPKTGDSGLSYLAVISVFSVAAAYSVRKKRTLKE